MSADLTRPLEPGELPRLYHELAGLGARAEGAHVRWGFGPLAPEEVLVVAAQASRRDPRLLWLLVELLARRYDRFDPLKLRRAAQESRWPATLAVALEFATRIAGRQELADYAAFVTRRFARGGDERFFLGTRAFGGALSRRDVEESLAEYRRWGYFSREEPIAKELGSPVRGTLRRPERMNLLRRLAGSKQAVTISDYLEELGGRGSRRQATRDLATAPFLKASGTTRGAKYRLHANESPAAPGIDRSCRPGLRAPVAPGEGRRGGRRLPPRDGTA